MVVVTGATNTPRSMTYDSPTSTVEVAVAVTFTAALAKKATHAAKHVDATCQLIANS
jgi:hypothetical protein